MSDSLSIQPFLKQLHEKCKLRIDWRNTQEFFTTQLWCNNLEYFMNKPINNFLVPMFQDDFNNQPGEQS